MLTLEARPFRSMISGANNDKLTARIALAIGALYAGGLLACVGGYFSFSGNPQPAAEHNRRITATFEDINSLGAASPGAESSPGVTPSPETTRQRGTSSLPLGSFVIGGAAACWGIWFLHRKRPAPFGNAEFLRSAYRDGVDPKSFHSEIDLEEIQKEVLIRRQRNILWSLPFWFTTLWFLIVGKGELGGPTLFGVSNLWLMGLTLGVFWLQRYFYWRCPPCDAFLPKFHSRLFCPKCGIALSGKKIDLSALR